ncbi:kinase-like protein [Sistotremastrum niveocremeum HHB9708]|uniref:Kinase-like protein n=1 Tax=Sistotremastrum niveocremeum HHB9708 TaxID=1314777 RepID=A0A164RTV1_9AGAM|nr:kinase-like protein [Sistotremastrum niveocremeum HHB9708]
MSHSTIHNTNTDSWKTTSLDFDDLTDRLIFVEEDELLPFGGFSVVHRAVHRSCRDKIFAVKVFRDRYKSEYHEEDTASLTLALDRNIIREMQIWSTISKHHPNILPFQGYCFYDRNGDAPILSLVSPWMRNGTLDQFLEDNYTVDQRKRIEILKDIVNGVLFLHKNGIVHGDLKPGSTDSM